MPGSFPQMILRKLIAGVLLSLSAAGCTGAMKAADADRGVTAITGDEFAGTWWNYYERALVYREKGLRPEAEKDLLQAVQGNDLDRRDIETPDGRIIEYFPHRELGILYYQGKEFMKAIEELSCSIESEPSARAHFFLNRARSANIKRAGLDHTPPEIVLEKSTAVEATPSFSKQIKAVARDDTYISSVMVGEEMIPLELARDTAVFTRDVPLREGKNIISVSATDLNGKSSTETLEIYGDFCGPIIELSELTSEKGMMTVRGNVSDGGGLHSLKINGHSWPITGHFEAYNFNFSQPQGTITITAQDRAGNVTQTILGETGPAVGSEDLFLPAASGQAEPSSPDVSGSGASPSPPGRSDPSANGQPLVYLEGVYGKIETYDDAIEFKIRVSDDEGIHSIFVNASPVLPKMGRTVFFSIRKKLRPGENKFHIVAFDRLRNKTDKRIIVTRHVSNIHQRSSRMKIAVLPFAGQEQQGNPAADLTETLAACFTTGQRFQAADFRTSEAFSEKSAPGALQAPFTGTAAGDYVPDDIDAVMTGSVNISSGYGEIVGRLFDVRTEKLMSVQDVFGEVAAPQDIKTLACGLAEKFKRDLPVKQGSIMEVNENRATISLGMQDGIKPHSRFIVYRESPPFTHPVTKSIIQSEPEILGTLQVTGVQEKTSAAEIISTISTVMPIRQYDRIIAR